MHAKKLGLGRSAEGSHPNPIVQIPLMEPPDTCRLGTEPIRPTEVAPVAVNYLDLVDRPQEVVFPGPEREVVSIDEVGLTPVISMRVDGRPELKVAVSGVWVSGLLDSGATVSVMSEPFWRVAGKGLLISDNGNLKAANGSALAVLGRANVELSLGRRKVSFSTLVVSNSTHPLILGMHFWRAGGLEITEPVGPQLAGVNPFLLRTHH